MLLAGDAGAGLHVEYLGRVDGLPSTQAHAVVQSPDGFVWIAGPGGLARYSGVKLEVLSSADGLSTHGLRSLALDHDRRLWIGSDIGVDVRHRDGLIRPLTEPEQWRFGFVEAMAPGSDGTMWLAASQGLVRWSEDTGVEPIEDPLLRDRMVTAVVTDATGGTWAAVTSVGLLRHDGRSWQPVAAAGIESVGRVTTVAVSPRGVLVGGERGLVELETPTSTVRAVSGSAENGAVSSLLVVGDELWVGIGRQLRQLTDVDGRWRAAQVALDNALVNDLAVDVLGNIWAATDNLGVVKISALRRIVRPVETACRSQVFAIAPGPEGSYLVAGDSCSWVMDADSELPRRRLASLDGIKTWDILWSRDTLWAATEQGLFQGDSGGEMSRLESPSETLSAPGRILLDDGDTLWVGTVKGLVSLSDGEARDHLDAAGHSLGYVYTLERDVHGRVWAGTIGNGLWRWTDGGFERVSTLHLKDSGNTYAIAFGRQRTAVAQDDRLVILESDRSWLVRREPGDAVAAWSALIDDDGALWAGGMRGLSRYDLEARETSMRLTSAMGLGGEEFTTSRSLFLAAGDRLFCGLDTGLAVVHRRGIASPHQDPEARLLGIEWTNAVVRSTDRGTVVEQGRWTFDAAVAAFWFIDEKSLSYRHRLVGFDIDWSAPQSPQDHRIHYTGLPPGDYTLEAQAHSPLVGWGRPVELTSFTVTPFWWRRPTALVLAAALLTAGGIGLWQRRNRLLIERAKMLEQRVGQRTRELESALARLEQLVIEDALTGLHNQRAFWVEAARFAAVAKRRRSPLALIVLDLDDFKRVNDTYGHQIGDEVLAMVARRLSGLTRESELLARYGGEEFVVLLPEAGIAEARRAAERLRRALAREPIRTSGGIELTMTASFGISCWAGPEDSVEELFRRADRAVYAAKETRNSIATAES